LKKKIRRTLRPRFSCSNKQNKQKKKALFFPVHLNNVEKYLAFAQKNKKYPFFTKKHTVGVHKKKVLSHHCVYLFVTEQGKKDGKKKK